MGDFQNPVTYIKCVENIPFRKSGNIYHCTFTCASKVSASIVTFYFLIIIYSKLLSVTFHDRNLVQEPICRFFIIFNVVDVINVTVVLS